MGGLSLLPKSTHTSSVRSRSGHTGGRGHLSMHPQPYWSLSARTYAIFTKSPEHCSGLEPGPPGWHTSTIAFTLHPE